MDLNRFVGKSEPDNLITDLYPAAKVVAVKLKKQAAETTLKRGTVLAVGDGTAVILGTAGADLVPSYILAEDTVVGTDEDAIGVAYRSGCFSPTHVIVTEGYTITAADLDALRTRDIVFKDFMS